MLGSLIDALSGRAARRKAALATIQPHLKHVGFRDSARAAALQGAPPGVTAADLEPLLPLVRPFAGDLVVAYAIDGSSTHTYIGQDYLDRHGIDAGQLHAAAVANLQSKFAAANAARQVVVCPSSNFFWFESSPPELVSAAALLPGVWKGFEKTYGSPLLVVLASREHVAFVPMQSTRYGHDESLMRMWLLKIAGTEAFDFSQRHALSAFCYVVRDGVFTVHDGLGEPGEDTAALLATPAGKALYDHCDMRPPPGAPKR